MVTPAKASLLTDGRKTGDGLIIGQGERQPLDVVVHHLTALQLEFGETFPWELLEARLGIRRSLCLRLRKREKAGVIVSAASISDCSTGRSQTRVPGGWSKK